MRVAVVGAGMMGSGIAQVAASAGHEVYLCDTLAGKAGQSKAAIARDLAKLVEKGRIPAQDRDDMLSRIVAGDDLAPAPVGLVIEAIAEDLAAKRALFLRLSEIYDENTVFVSNTSSMSISAIAAGLPKPGRFAGLHFFNPAPVMKLVEIVAGAATEPAIITWLNDLMKAWRKIPVLAKNTPGFIVNRLARPYYGEAMKILEERAAAPAVIDAIWREGCGFRLGPFELIDMIGLDINYAVTCSVWEAFFYDARFRPSQLQRDLVDAGWLGRKTGRGFYDYAHTSSPPVLYAEPGRAPETVTVLGDLGPAAPLIGLFEQAGIKVSHQAGDGEILCGATSVRLTDGRPASVLKPGTIVFDAALDYKAATRICLAKAPSADPQAISQVIGLFQALGKKVSVVADIPGLVCARTLAMIVNEAVEASHLGVCTQADADLAMRYGTNYPFGPFEMLHRLGANYVRTVLGHMAGLYGDGRYRTSLGFLNLS